MHPSCSYPAYLSEGCLPGSHCAGLLTSLRMHLQFQCTVLGGKPAIFKYLLLTHLILLHSSSSTLSGKSSASEPSQRVSQSVLIRFLHSSCWLWAEAFIYIMQKRGYDIQLNEILKGFLREWTTVRLYSNLKFRVHFSVSTLTVSCDLLFSTDP